MGANIDITGQYTVNGVPVGGGGTNPTNGFFPVNKNGVFADSPLSYDSVNKIVNSVNDINIGKPSGDPGIFKLFLDAQQGPGYIPGNAGIQWGFYNSHPMFGPVSYLDCEIKNVPAAMDMIGSGLDFRVQKFSVYQAPIIGNNIITLLQLKPWESATYTGGVTVWGGDSVAVGDAYFNVAGDDGDTNPQKFSDVTVRIAGVRGAFVPPLTDNSSQGMIMPEIGMIVYNAQIEKLQVYSAGSWVNLH